jgi:hypothetical protein
VSALESLAKLLLNFGNCELKSVMERLVTLLKRALDSSVTALRKVSIECLVVVYYVIADETWNYLRNFDETQRKLLGVFIIRSRKNSRLTT